MPAVSYDLNDEKKRAKLNAMNNAATALVFFTVLVNIFITALGFEGHDVRSAITDHSSDLHVVNSCDLVLLLPHSLPVPGDQIMTGEL